MESVLTYVSLVTFTIFPLGFTQWLQSEWSSEELQEVIPCYGQEMTNSSFRVGKKQITSELMYNYYLVFEGDYNHNLDCTFNHPDISRGGVRFGYGPYNWIIDRIDIASSGGLDCLGGGVGYSWYRFRLYGRSYRIEYRASIWITWRGSSIELMYDPAYLVRCVYEGTDRMASPINFY